MNLKGKNNKKTNSIAEISLDKEYVSIWIHSSKSDDVKEWFSFDKKRIIKSVTRGNN